MASVAGVDAAARRAVRRTDVDAAPQRNHRGEADVHRCREIEHAVHTAPDCEISASRPGCVGIGPERRVQPDVGADDAERTRSDQANAALARRARHLASPCALGRTVGRVGRRHHDGSADVGAQRRSRMAGTAPGGVAMTARSTGLPIARERRERARPRMRRWLGLTANRSPLNSPAMQVLEHAATERAWPCRTRRQAPRTAESATGEDNAARNGGGSFGDGFG